MSRPFAVVTGGSEGLGFELARLAAADGHEVLLVAEGPGVETAAARLGAKGGAASALRADLSTARGVEALLARIGDRPVDRLMANAGIGLGHGFLDQDWREIERVIALNVVGTTALLHRVLRGMAARGAGRVLVTGSVAGMIPGSGQAVYNATKAYLDNLAPALGSELAERGVTVTCLRPGPVDTGFFARAGLADTPLGRSRAKADPARVARAGYAAMTRGRAEVTPGLAAKAQAALSGVLPETWLARMHRRAVRPDGGGR